MTFQTSDLKYLLEVTRCLTSIHEPQALFETVVEKAVELTGACRGYLFLLEAPCAGRMADFQDFQNVADFKAAEWAKLSEQHFVSRRASIQAVNTKEAVQLETQMPMVNGSANHSLVNIGINSILVEPIVRAGEALGVLYLDSRKHGAFRDEHIAMLPSFAAQVAICLENLRLSQEREEALKRKHQESVCALRAKASESTLSSHLRMASHDLKGPLTSLRTGLALLRRRYEIAKEDPVYEDMELSIERAVQLVVSYLDLEALTGGAELPLRFEEVDLSQTVAQEIRLIRSQLPPKHRDRFRFAVSITPGTHLWGDRRRLSQVFYNLLSNAVKYSPRGGDVVVQHVDSPLRHLVSVRDQGPGLSEEATEQVMEAFARSSEHPRVEGHGLGLFLVKQLVAAHKGSVEVESKPGEGTTVWLGFPKQKSVERPHSECDGSGQGHQSPALFLGRRAPASSQRFS